MEPTKTNDTKPGDGVSPSTSLATAPPPAPAEIVHVAPWQMTLEPKDFGAAWELADMMARIQFCGCQKPEDALARIMYGRNLGMTAMAAMSNVHIIEGKPGIEAATMRGICLQRPDVCEKFEIIASSPTSATVRGKRRGHEQVRDVTFTIEDATRAALLDRGATPEKQAKNNWNRYPEDMCIARASARLARQLFPDLIRGFSTSEELNDQKRMRLAGIIDAEVVDPSPSSAVDASNAGRDYAKELADYKAACITAKDKKEFAQLRDEYKKHKDAGHPLIGDFESAYNDAKKRAFKPESEATPAKAEEPAK